MDAQAAGRLNAGAPFDSALALQRLHVQTSDGRRVGRVFDVRTEWTPGDSTPLAVRSLLVGRAGWMERVGLRPRHLHVVPWSAVKGWREGVLVVDAEALSFAPR